METPENTQQVVARPTCLAPFNELRNAIELCKVENKKQVFDYATPEGEKAARSYCYKLRLSKGVNVQIHKAAKADVLATGQMMDKEKREIDEAINDMVEYHMKPINEIKAKREAEAQALKEAEEKAKADAEAARLQKIADDEAAAKKILEEAQAEADRIRGVHLEQEMKQRAENEATQKAIEIAANLAQKAQDEHAAKIKAEQAAAQKKLDDERAKFEAEKKAEADAKAREEAALRKAHQDKLDALEKAEQDKKDALAKAEQEKQDAINEERRIAHQKENDRIAKELAKKLEADRLEAKEKARIADIERKEAEKKANEEHRERVELQACGDLHAIIANSVIAAKVTDAIRDGKIRHVTINY